MGGTREGFTGVREGAGRSCDYPSRQITIPGTGQRQPLRTVITATSTGGSVLRRSAGAHLGTEVIGTVIPVRRRSRSMTAWPEVLAARWARSLGTDLARFLPNG